MRFTHAICFEYDIHLDYEMEEWLCNFMADHIREVVEILDTILSETLKKSLHCVGYYNIICSTSVITSK